MNTLAIGLCMFVVHTSWSMLTVNKIQPIPLKKYWTQEKIEGASHTFLNSFGQHSIAKTGHLFCNLPIKAKEHVLSRLSYNQKLLVWFGAQSLDIPLLTVVCNGNDKVAHLYHDKSINELWGAYAHAKEWQKFGKMDLEHFMVLTNKEISLCKDVFLQSTILPSDAPRFIHALKKLKNIEPDLETSIITDAVKLYPTFKEQALLFWSIPLPPIAYELKIRAGIVIGLEQGLVYFGKKLGLIIDSTASQPLIFISIASLTLDLFYKYIHTQMNIKNNILPTQPTLTGNNSKDYDIEQ